MKKRGEGLQPHPEGMLPDTIPIFHRPPRPLPGQKETLGQTGLESPGCEATPEAQPFLDELLPRRRPAM